MATATPPRPPKRPNLALCTGMNTSNKHSSSLKYWHPPLESPQPATKQLQEEELQTTTLSLLSISPALHSPAAIEPAESRTPPLGMGALCPSPPPPPPPLGTPSGWPCSPINPQARQHPLPPRLPIPQLLSSSTAPPRHPPHPPSRAPNPHFPHPPPHRGGRAGQGPGAAAGLT